MKGRIIDINPVDLNVDDEKKQKTKKTKKKTENEGSGRYQQLVGITSSSITSGPDSPVPNHHEST